MGHACFRGRSGMSKMVSDVVGYFGNGSLPPLGWRRRELYVRLASPAQVVLILCSGTCLWLWLGVLDAVQGVGLGMILLQTLSRLHVCATLAGAQLLGSCVVMIARYVPDLRCAIVLGC